MANIFKDLIARIKIDYQEFRIDWITRWNTRRDIKHVDSAIRRARVRHERDHRTYYVIQDIRGTYNALTKKEIDKLATYGFFPKMTILQVLEKAVAIISANKYMNNMFKEVKRLKKSKNNGKG